MTRITDSDDGGGSFVAGLPFGHRVDVHGWRGGVGMGIAEQMRHRAREEDRRRIMQLMRHGTLDMAISCTICTQTRDCRVLLQVGICLNERTQQTNTGRDGLPLLAV